MIHLIYFQAVHVGFRCDKHIIAAILIGLLNSSIVDYGFCSDVLIVSCNKLNEFCSITKFRSFSLAESLCLCFGNKLINLTLLLCLQYRIECDNPFFPNTEFNFLTLVILETVFKSIFTILVRIVSKRRFVPFIILFEYPCFLFGT